MQVFRAVVALLQEYVALDVIVLMILQHSSSVSVSQILKDRSMTVDLEPVTRCVFSFSYWATMQMMRNP